MVLTPNEPLLYYSPISAAIDTIVITLSNVYRQKNKVYIVLYKQQKIYAKIGVYFQKSLK